MWATSSQTLWSRCQAASRSCKIPYSRAAAAALDVQRADAARAAAARRAASQAPATRGRRPFPSAPEHQDDAAARSRARCRGPRARRPPRRRHQQPAALAVAQEVGEVAHARDRQVLDRARPTPCTPPGVTSAERRSADHDARRARALGRAADRAEVLRVLDLVERDDQRRRARASSSPRRRRGRARPRRRRPGGRRCRARRATSSAVDDVDRHAGGGQPRLARRARSSPRRGARAGGRPAAPRATALRP